MTEKCCEKETVFVSRVRLFDNSNSSPEPIRSSFARSQNIVDFKAMSMRNGLIKRLSQSRRQVSAIETKQSSALRTVSRSAARIAIPGDIDPLRSPVRSAIYRTITPGLPGGGLSAPAKPNRGYRCPEGYQYGGRFTDSRLSTCGAKLFDIPSPLGLALSALRRAARGIKPGEPISGRVLGAGEMPESIIDSRRPQIPKVSNPNPNAVSQQKNQLIRDISLHGAKVSRMIRRDGFVLEPVVAPKVLRAIPDNRDMEGATYLMSAFGSPDIGNDELGMLSNTGIKSLIYVLPSGSTLTIEKRRPLTVGERRKLGKTVTQAMAQDNSRDPSARLKYLSNEMGDGIGYSEEFGNIKNPNEVIRGRQKWATEAFKPRKGSKVVDESKPTRSTVSTSAVGKKIKSVDDAIEAIVNGESLSRIDPTIMPQVLARSRVIQRSKINNDQSLVVVGSEKYLEYLRPTKFQHIGERFASDLQEHLGLASPDILFADKPGDKRRYLRQDVEAVIPGAKFNPNRTLKDFRPQDVARMMISDLLSDQRERQLSSVYALDTPDGPIPVMAQNTTSGLADLSEIEITERTKMSISQFYEGENQIDYSEYYNQLKIEQQIQYRNFIDSLLRRARSFKMKDLLSKLSIDGLTDGEKAHLKIINRIYEARVGILDSQKKTLIEMLKG